MNTRLQPRHYRRFWHSWSNDEDETLICGAATAVSNTFLSNVTVMDPIVGQLPLDVVCDCIDSGTRYRVQIYLPAGGDFYVYKWRCK